MSYIYTRITEADFIGTFLIRGRGHQFTDAALHSIFKELESLAEDTNTPIELDVIAICCEYTENFVEHIAAEYGIDITDCGDDEDMLANTVLTYIRDESGFAELTDEGTIVYRSF